MEILTRTNDLTRLERFKEWAKKNLVGLRGVAIMAASLITSIIAITRSVVKKGAKAVSAFGKALAEVSKTLGPIISAVLNIMGQIFSYGAKGISWLAKNLWALALLLVLLVYEKARKRRNKFKEKRKKLFKMETDRNKKLAPGYNKTTKSSVKGKRLFNTTSLLKKEATPGDEYYVTMPQLGPNQVIVPDTMNLVFKNGNTKCHFKNNVGRLQTKT